MPSRSAATTYAAGVIGLAAAVSLVPVALYAGATWWLFPLFIAMFCSVYLLRPA